MPRQASMSRSVTPVRRNSSTSFLHGLESNATPRYSTPRALAHSASGGDRWAIMSAYDRDPAAQFMYQQQSEEEEKQFAQLSEQLTEKNRELAQLSAQLAILQSKGGDVSDGSERLQNEIRRYEGDQKQLRESMRQRTEELAARNTEIGELEVEIASIRSVLGQANGDGPESSDVVSKTVGAWFDAEVNAKDQIVQSLRQRIECTKADISDKSAQITKRKGDVLAIEGEIAQATAEAKQLWWKLKLASKEAAAKEHLQREVERLEMDVKAKSDELDARASQLRQERTSVQQVEEQLKAVEGQAAAKRREVAENQYQQAEYQEELSVLEERNFEMSYRTEELAMKEKVLGTCAAFVDEEAQAWAQSVSRRAVATISPEQVSQLREDVARKTCELTGANTQLAMIRSELAGKKIESERLNGAVGARTLQIDQKAEEIKHLRAELDQACDETLCKHGEVDRGLTAEEVEAMEMQIRQELHGKYTRHVEDLKARLQETRDALAGKENQSLARSQSFHNDKDNLRNELNGSAARNEQLSNTVNSLQDSVRQKDAKLDEMRQRLSALEAKCYHSAPSQHAQHVQLQSKGAGSGYGVGIGGHTPRARTPTPGVAAYGGRAFDTQEVRSPTFQEALRGFTHTAATAAPDAGAGHGGLGLVQYGGGGATNVEQQRVHRLEVPPRELHHGRSLTPVTPARAAHSGGAIGGAASGAVTVAAGSPVNMMASPNVGGLAMRGI